MNPLWALDVNREAKQGFGLVINRSDFHKKKINRSDLGGCFWPRYRTTYNLHAGEAANADLAYGSQLRPRRWQWQWGEEWILVSVRLRLVNAREAERSDGSDWECAGPTGLMFRGGLS
jgi:hypothetical protein